MTADQHRTRCRSHMSSLSWSRSRHCAIRPCWTSWLGTCASARSWVPESLLSTHVMECLCHSSPHTLCFRMYRCEPHGRSTCCTCSPKAFSRCGAVQSDPTPGPTLFAPPAWAHACNAARPCLTLSRVRDPLAPLHAGPPSRGCAGTGASSTSRCWTSSTASTWRSVHRRSPRPRRGWRRFRPSCAGLLRLQLALALNTQLRLQLRRLHQPEAAPRPLCCPGS